MLRCTAAFTAPCTTPPAQHLCQTSAALWAAASQHPHQLAQRLCQNSAQQPEPCAAPCTAPLPDFPNALSAAASKQPQQLSQHSAQHPRQPSLAPAALCTAACIVSWPSFTALSGASQQPQHRIGHSTQSAQRSPQPRAHHLTSPCTAPLPHVAIALLDSSLHNTLHSNVDSTFARPRRRTPHSPAQLLCQTSPLHCQQLHSSPPQHPHSRLRSL